MISHVHVGITDFGRAFSFYAALMDALGYPLRFSEPEKSWAGWNPADRQRPLFLIGQAYNGERATSGNGQMVALLAFSRNIVDRCHALALARGGVSEGAPGLRPEYHPNYYGAYFRDPDGNKLCVCCHEAPPDSDVDMVLAGAPSDEIAALIGELNDELDALYTPEQRHGLALEAIFQPHIRFFVAYGPQGAVGCGGVALFADFAEVKRMYVRRDQRGQGVADAIMTRLIAEARAAGLKILRLETGAQSFAAIRFYQRAGFQPCEKFEPYAAMPPHSIEASRFLEKRL